MKPSEFRELSDEELETKEAELKDRLFKLRFQHAVGQLENTMRLKDIKRDMARIYTIRREREAEK
ncbi:MAG: 50S ribosomal protein L29 [Candidatus Aminicenantes bacterium]|nr:50S ribosomal protein L29 [Candidatus Aminicenantes bacterium]